MKLTNIDLNELLPIYAQDAPIANAIGEAVASAIGAIFGRCESLPCEASSVACDAMRDDELDRVAQDLQIVIYDPSASHEEKARFVYEFAGTRYTAGSYSNLKKGLSIFADNPEDDVRIERESTWRYYIQLESPPAVSIERQRIMERLIPKAHRAVLGFDGMDIHYGNDGDSRLFTPAGNACADTLVNGEASVRPLSEVPLKVNFVTLGNPSPFSIDITSETGSVSYNEHIPRNKKFRVTVLPEISLTQSVEFDRAFKYGNPHTITSVKPVAMGNSTYPEKLMEGTDGFSDKPYYLNGQILNFETVERLRTAINPLPVYYWRKNFPAFSESIVASQVDVSTMPRQFAKDKAAIVSRYCIAIDFANASKYAKEELDEAAGDTIISEFADGTYNDLLFNEWLKPTYEMEVGGSETWVNAYLEDDPRTKVANWADVIDDAAYKGSCSGMSTKIFQKWGEVQQGTLIANTVLSNLSLDAWYHIFIPYPREWA